MQSGTAHLTDGLADKHGTPYRQARHILLTGLLTSTAHHTNGNGTEPPIKSPPDFPAGPYAETEKAFLE
ncbi:MAG: hypothetical protein EA408_07225 [Marinilabiliales bacterium]|nr:MAG: hypothetical protein EA408_07225 [Marinilabiliales bacterium]